MDEFLGYTESEEEANEIINKDKKTRKALGLDDSHEKYKSF